MPTTIFNFGPVLDRVDNNVRLLLSQVQQLLGATQQIIGLLQQPEPDLKPARVRFDVPERYDLTTGKMLPMALNVMNDVITKVRLVFDNVAGVPVPEPSGDQTSVSLTISAGDTTPSDLGTVAMDKMSNGDPAVAITPARKGVSLGNATVMFTDVFGGVTLSAPPLDIVFTNDAEATSVHFDTTSVETSPMP